MRGDRPSPTSTIVTICLFTPHARGSTTHLRVSLCDRPVYPACAGIDRYGEDYITVTVGLPRMRGDRPRVTTSRIFRFSFTPHARGSTAEVYRPLPPAGVYPACAGIDRFLHPGY